MRIEIRVCGVAPIGMAMSSTTTETSSVPARAKVRASGNLSPFVSGWARRRTARGPVILAPYEEVCKNTSLGRGRRHCYPFESNGVDQS